MVGYQDKILTTVSETIFLILRQYTSILMVSNGINGIFLILRELNKNPPMLGCRFSANLTTSCLTLYKVDKFLDVSHFTF